MKKISIAEEKIKEAARNEFITAGFAGARMQRIAKNANINSALLHYYFRSKENLFEIIFSDAINSIFDTINKTLSESHKDIFAKISQIINDYVDFVFECPQLPMFVLMEFSYNPDRIKNLSIDLNASHNFKLFADQIEKAKSEKIIRDTVNSQDVFTDILSLTLFQFTVEPFLSTTFSLDRMQYVEFIQRRKTVIAETIINSIKN